MSINVGVGKSGSARVLRLTLSGETILQAARHWGQDTPRLSWRASALGDGRWSITFRPDKGGNVAHSPSGFLNTPGDKRYLTWTWGLKPNTLLGLHHSLQHPNRGELVSWNDDGSLTLVARGDRVRPRPGAPKKMRDHLPTPEATPGTRTTPATRLGGLRTALNHAIEELQRVGLSVRVTQPSAGEPIQITIDI